MSRKGTGALPRLGRRGKVIRNFILSAVLLALVWTALGSPLPPSLAFHRLELRYLREPSQIVAQVEQDGDTYVVGFAEQEAVLGDLEGGGLSFWKLPEEGTGLMVAAGQRAVNVSTTWLLSMNAPEEAVTAHLEMELSAWMVKIGADRDEIVLELPAVREGKYWQEHWTYSVEGQRLPAGEFLFRVDAHDQTSWQEAPGGRVGEQMALAELAWDYLYTQSGPEHNPDFFAKATFYNEQGETVGEACLSPEEHLVYPIQ